jgi:hypothetical protein
MGLMITATLSLMLEFIGPAETSWFTRTTSEGSAVTNKPGNGPDWVP